MDEKAAEAVSSCGCALCRQNVPFSMPEGLLAAIRAGELVLFAGAGISTEGKMVAPTTLFEDVVEELGLEPDSTTFPGAMGDFVELHGRPVLLRRIAERLKYVKDFPELEGQATAFHRELGPIYQIQDIVTTNWDTSFEDVCGAMPIVVPEDYAFWQTTGRKVFKIHGSITNWGTVVATDRDYAACYRRLSRGVIGASLKHLLATKQIMFVGYSLGDSDFQRLYAFLRREMGDVLPRSYIVTLDPRITEGSHPGSTVVHTAGTFLLQCIKEHFVAQGYLLDERAAGAAAVKLIEVQREHLGNLSRIDLRAHPEALYTHAYQDGLSHSLERLLARFGTGEYSDPWRLSGIIDSYRQIRRTALRGRGYWDVAYIDGYTNGLEAVLEFDAGPFDQLPIYYLFGKGGIGTFAEYEELAQDASRLHRTAYRIAEQVISHHGENVVLHHMPWLIPPIMD